MQDIEVVLVAGRRPELLEPTLSSFRANLFNNFRILKFSANIDPFGGGTADQEACRRILLRHFPNAQIFEPKEASFGGAVKRLWASTMANIVLHLEDDWILESNVSSADIDPLGKGQVAAMPLLSDHHKILGPGLYYEHDYQPKLLGLIKLKKRRLPRFGTSPRFLVGDFARRCASMMNPKMDPEKQMQLDFNPMLTKYMIDYRSLLIAGPDRSPIIRDIGREWQVKNGLKKIVKGGYSRWEAGSVEKRSRERTQHR